MDAPDGMSRYQEPISPPIAPEKPIKTDQIAIFLKSVTNKFAIACGIVSKDKINMMPATFILKTMVRAINAMMR